MSKFKTTPAKHQAAITIAFDPASCSYSPWVIKIDGITHSRYCTQMDADAVVGQA